MSTQDDAGPAGEPRWTDDEWLTALNVLAGHSELRDVRMTAYADILAHVRGQGAQVGQLTRTLRMRESDLAALLDREQELVAQVATLTAERERLRAAAGTALAWLGTYQCSDEEEGDDLIALEQQLYAALNATTPAPAAAGKEV